MKKILAIAAGLVLTLSVMTACQNANSSGKETEHEHTFEEHWSSDEQNHWHASTCEHEDEISDKASHVDEDGNDVCDVCGFRNEHVHTYASEWTKGDKTHYYKNTCGHDDVEKYRKDEAVHEDKNNDSLCDVCAYDYGHAHTYAEGWTKADKDGHWHAPTCGHDVPGADKTNHVDADNNGLCDDCAYDYDHTHTYAEEWANNEDEHWREVTCGHTVPVADKNAHVDADGDKDCDICGYAPEHFHTFETTWSADAEGHFHKANCGHEAKADQQPHNGYEEDGVCDACAYTVFRFYTVSVILPDDSFKVIAPDGTVTPTFAVKEQTDATFTLTLPERLLLVSADGATVEGKPTKKDGYRTYTLKVAAIQADVTVTLKLDKTSNVEVIVADGKYEMTDVKGWNKITGTLTFHVPASGRYIIYSSSHPGLMGVTFDLPGNTVEQYQNGISYNFDVAGEGDVTLNWTYWPDKTPEGGKEIFTYVVAKIDPEKTLETLEGEGYTMPTNAGVKISFTVPEAGLYQISSSYPIAWNDDVTKPHVFMVKEGELTHTLTMYYDMATASSFPFDWKIEKLAESMPIELGDTAVTAPLEGYAAVVLTAPLDGAYHFSVSDPNMALYQWYSSEYWSTMNQLGTSWIAEEVKAGDQITLYVRVNIYNDEIKDDIDGTLSIGYVPTADERGYIAQVGLYNVFENSDYLDGEFSITLPEGGQISLDGGKTWQSSVESIRIPGYGTVSYLVKGDGNASTVVVLIEKLVYESTLTVGSNTVTMIPGKEYTFTLSGTASPDYYASYLLHWTDAQITVSYGGQNLTSGSLIDRYNAYSSSLTITYSGTETAEITFELEDTYVVPGITPSMLNGTYQVNLMMEGLYIVTFTPSTPDAQSGTLTVVDNNTYSTQQCDGEYLYTYKPATGVTVTSLSGAPVNIYISATASGSLTFQGPGLAKPQTLVAVNAGGGSGSETPNPPVSDGALVLGANAVSVAYWSETTVTFTATESGSYVIRFADGETNGEIGVNGDYGFEPYSTPYTVRLAAGSSFTFTVVTIDYEADVIDIIIEKKA